MIRDAKKEDADQLAPLIMLIWQDMELAILQKYPLSLLREILVQAIQTEDYRFGYRNLLVYEAKRKVAGLLCGYRGVQEPTIDQAWTKIGVRYGLQAEDKVFVEAETLPGEWYIDSIVTHPDFRGQQIGTRLLQAAPQKAALAGETVMGLNCDQANLHAKRLYTRLGFVTMGQMILSGHIYDHMQRKI